MGIAVRCSLAFALGLSMGCAQAQNTAKELFVGVDGDTTRLASGPLTTPRHPKVLGLQTTIYQLFEDGGTKAVSPSTIFEGGSRIRLGFNANRAGYLYIINVGSSGKVTTLFPSSINDNNQVRPGLVYQIPQQNGKSIRFDTTPGQESLLVVLAESRISQFDYGGQPIAINAVGNDSGAPAKPQSVAVASLDAAATSKDLFVEDDGVFQTTVFKPESEASNMNKPLVTALKLAHR